MFAGHSSARLITIPGNPTNTEDYYVYCPRIFPAYDDLIQATSGIAALNRGTEDEPRYIPTIVCDKVGGLHLAMAMLAGIAHQAKTRKGCVIESLCLKAQ